MHRLLLPLLVLLALAAPTAASAQPACPGADAMPTAATLASARAATLCLLNQQRTSHGLSPVRPNARLRAAAESYSREMVANRFFEHVSPVTGSTLQSRIRAVRYLAGFGSWELGENIAWGSGEFATPAFTVDAWMHSAGHRRNILTRRFRQIGIGVVLGAPATVPPELGAATYTTDFGVRS